MKKYALALLIVVASFSLGGCYYVPKTVKPPYYENAIVDIRNDIDDVSSARF